MEDFPPREFLNYHHLRYFWAVAREGTLRAAAEKLRVSQPSMSAQIKLLEASLGEHLFRPRGRKLELTEFGKVVFDYAEEIFAVGGEILRAAKQVPASRKISLKVGIVDSFPKLLGFEILSPVFEHHPPVQLTCGQGKPADLLEQLRVHHIDVVLSDEPASSLIAGKVFNHLLGTCGVTFCAIPRLARTLRGRFPRNLNDAPFLLPTQSCHLRRDLEKWFGRVAVKPRVVAEFDDSVLLKLVAARGIGIIPVPSIMEKEAAQRFDFIPIGRTLDLEVRLYAITAERKLIHPAVFSLTETMTKRLQTRTKRGRAAQA